MKKIVRYMVGDFETTVYDGQEFTEVWASGLCEFYSEEAIIFHSIDETFNYLNFLHDNIILYYHNLKFDGSFILNYLIAKGYSQDYTELDDEEYLEMNFRVVKWNKPKYMKRKSFQYSISRLGQWYKILICLPNGKSLEIRDSLKLLPFSLKTIGENFNTKHKKLEMEYTGFRYAGCEITDAEKEYLKNDLYVIKEALEFMFSQGHTRLTIGSCCMEEFKIDAADGLLDVQAAFDARFPNQYNIPLNKEEYGENNAGDYIHRSYRGGWCYLVKGKEEKVYHNGTTADVNSLYPSMMHSESGNVYPYGNPTFWRGNYIPDKMQERYIDGKIKYFYFVRIKTSFHIKPGKLPFIQIKGNPLYKANEMLETSDIWDFRKKRYIRWIDKKDGTFERVTVELTLTMMDYELFLEHYDTDYLEILDGCYYLAMAGIFDGYIDKYRELKLKSKGAMRELAKLFLNSLYGKMGATTDSSFKIASISEKTGGLHFDNIREQEKQPGYLPIGSAITSYARCFTIRAAQVNYHGVNKPGFIYADTDSIHCNLPPDKIKGITVHDKNFCCWKLESCWDTAIFVRQKTYIEHVTHENQIPVEELKTPKKPYYNVKCAGMPKNCKDLFILSMTQDFETDEAKEIITKLDADELAFIYEKRELTDFKIGLQVPGKLEAKQIRGGVLLKKGPYTMTPQEGRIQ